MITVSVLKGLKRRLWHRCFFAKFLRTPISHRTPPVVVSERITTNKSNFGRQEYLRFHIWFIMTLYYNKCDSGYYNLRQLFYYKIRQRFIIKCARFFFAKCDSFITNCDSYYKVRFYYKMWCFPSP